MKRILTLCAIVAGFVGVPAAQAAIVTNETVSQPVVAFVRCANGGAGERVVGTFDLHVLITSTVNGNHRSAKMHYQLQGVSLVGEETGDIYRATGGTQQMSSASLQNGQSEFTFVNNFRLIGPGPGNNLLVHETHHVTINANGEVIATNHNSTVDCK